MHGDLLCPPCAALQAKQQHAVALAVTALAGAAEDTAAIRCSPSKGSGSESNSMLLQSRYCPAVSQPLPARQRVRPAKQGRMLNNAWRLVVPTMRCTVDKAAACSRSRGRCPCQGCRGYACHPLQL